MNSKNLLIILVILVGVIGILGWRIKSTSSSAENNNETITLTTEPNPLKLGPATFIITVKDNQGKAVDKATVFFDLNMTAMNMGTQQGNATAMGNGKYSASGRLTMMGPWRVTVKVTMPDGSLIQKSFTVNVK